MPPQDERDTEPVEVLTPQKSEAIQALLTEHTIAKAAASVGVSQATLYRWMREPEFRAELRAQQRECWSAISRKLTSSGIRAVEVLEGILRGTEKATSARVTAATSVLTMIFRWCQAADVEERLERVERHLEMEP